MAPKRSVKSVFTNNNNNYNNLTLNDVLCPICRSILIEPVTLPCNHGFCSSCFDGTIANTNLVCPLCRVRIGSWLRRTSKKDNKLINSVLWEAIQKIFPEQVKNKLQGNEEYPEEDVPRRLTAPGEIRKEYEIQKAKELLELQKQRDSEAEASEEYIRKLREHEEFEESVRQKNLRLSEQVAKKLSQEYSFDPGPSSSKANSVVSSKCKKQGPIDRLLKNMSQKKVTVTVQPVPENSVVSKEYTCKILCQDKNKARSDRNVFDKAALLNWKIQDKLRKIVTEGEASDSNDSITSECRYFKPIDQKGIPLPQKVSIIKKVPAITATANTVIIGPPKGETKFTHTSTESAFADVRILTLPPLTPKNVSPIKKQSTPAKRKLSGVAASACDMTVIELAPVQPESMPGNKKNSPKRQTRNKTESADVLRTPPSRKYETRNKTNQKSPVKSEERSSDKARNLSLEFASYTTPSKRKRLRSSPEVEKHASSKRTRYSLNSAIGSPPFLGFDNEKLEPKSKNNGAIAVQNMHINNVNSKFNNGNVNDNLRKLQVDEDFEYAKKLQEELNNRGRYSTRNSISVNNTRNVRKPTTKQVTLKEIVAKTAGKVP